MIGNMLPTEATDNALDLFEKRMLIVTFGVGFCRKVGPVYSPNGPTLEFEVADTEIFLLVCQKFSYKSNAR